MILFLNLLQSTEDVKAIISTNDATVTGILLGAVLLLGSATVYLYKENKAMQKEIVAELKEFNASLIKINKQYDDFVTNFEKYRMKDV